MLLQAARDFQNGKTPQSARPNFDLNKIRARTAEATDSEDWRELVEPRAAATSVTLIRT
jgi:hypothetical protein